MNAEMDISKNQWRSTGGQSHETTIPAYFFLTYATLFISKRQYYHQFLDSSAFENKNSL